MKKYISLLLATLLTITLLFFFSVQSKEASDQFYSNKVVTELEHYIGKNPYLISYEDALCSIAVPKDKLKLTAAQCLGQPYLYLTYHGGKNGHDVRTVCKYTRDGCSLGSVTNTNKLHNPRSFRGLLIDEGFLLVAESYKKDSKLLLYDRCNVTNQNRRDLLAVLVKANKTEPKMIHPYGFAQDPLNPENIYVSTQGPNAVLKFKRSIDPKKPGSYKLKFQSSVVSFSDSKIRGIAFDNSGRLYVANKQKGVGIYKRNGDLKKFLTKDISVPITVYFQKETEILWVGCAETHRIVGYDVKDYSIVKKIKHPYLEHPAGMVIYNDSLFVVSQDANKLLEFSTSTGKLLNVVLPTLPDDGERIILSEC